MLTVKKNDENRPLPSSNPIASMRGNDERVEKAIEDVRKKISSSSPAIASSAPPSSSTASKGASSSEMDAKLRTYYARIWALIQRQWALPKGILPEHDLKTVIVIVILKDGTLAGLNIEKSSGNKYFDQSAARAIKKASPFPMLPDSIKESSIDIGIRFNSSEFH
jgi:TolA protein